MEVERIWSGKGNKGDGKEEINMEEEIRMNKEGKNK